MKTSQKLSKTLYFYLYLVAAQNKNICPRRVSNPPQTLLKANHFYHSESKIFFLKSKNFLAYLIEHLKIRLILNYFLILLFLERTT